MDLGGIAAALKGMFRLRPNSPAHQQMLDNLNELKSVSAEVNSRPALTVDDAIRQLVGDRNA